MQTFTNKQTEIILAVTLLAEDTAHGFMSLTVKIEEGLKAGIGKPALVEACIAGGYSESHARNTVGTCYRNLYGRTRAKSEKSRRNPKAVSLLEYAMAQCDGNVREARNLIQTALREADARLKADVVKLPANNISGAIAANSGVAAAA